MDEQKEIKSVKCRDCDRVQAFEMPEIGKTIEVKCRECGNLIVKVTKNADGTVTLDPPDTELISL